MGVVGLAFVCAIVAAVVEKHVIILITSFVGSYCFVRGISLYAGGFPNEAELETDVKDGKINWSSFSKWFYVYLAGIIVMTIFGLIYQCKNEAKAKARKASRESRLSHASNSSRHQQLNDSRHQLN